MRTILEKTFQGASKHWNVTFDDTGIDFMFMVKNAIRVVANAEGREIISSFNWKIIFPAPMLFLAILKGNCH